MKIDIRKFMAVWLACFLVGIAGKAQVTVTSTPVAGLCAGNLAYTNVADITIAETQNSDIPTTTSESLIFNMPVGFELEPNQGTISIAGGGGDNILSYSITATTITIEYEANNSATGFVLSGLRVRATAAGNGDMTVVNGGTVNGLTGTLVSFSSIATPALTVVSSGASACVGESVFFAGLASGATQYEFVLKQGATIVNTQAYSATNFYISATTLPAGSYTMEARAKNAGGCESAINSQAFVINALPAAPSISSPQTFCLNTPTTTALSATASGTIRWYNQANLISPIATGTSVTFSSLGINTSAPNTYVFYLTNYNGCESAPVAVVVNISAKPSLNVSASASAVCAGKTINFSASGTGSEYQYVLKKGGAVQQTQAFSSATLYTTDAGLPVGNDYTIEITSRNGAGCLSDMVATNFAIDALPAAPTFANSTVYYCDGTNIATQQITASGITGGNTVEWYADASLSSVLATGAAVNITSLNISSPAVAPNIYVRYALQRDPVTGCASAATAVTVQMVAKPVASLVGSRSKICQGGTINFLAGGTTGVDYVFTLSQGGTPIATTSPSTANNYTIPSNLPVGNYSVTATAINSNSCQGQSNTVSFSVYANPVVNFPTPATTSFLETDTTGVSLAANETTSLSGAGVFSGQGVSNGKFYPSASGGVGSKTVTYTFTSTDGCSASQSVVFVVNSAGFFLAKGYCQSDGLMPFSVPSTCPTATITDVSVDAGVPAASVQASSGNFYLNPSAMTIPASGDYVIWKGKVLAPVCSPYYYSVSTKIFRSPTPAINGATSVCQNETATYSAPLHTFSTATGTVTYAWSFDPSPSFVSGTMTTNANTASIQWTTAGSARLVLTETIAYKEGGVVVTSCAKVATHDIIIKPLPTGNITPNTAVCKGESVTYSAPAGNYNYSWTVVNGTITSANNAQTVTVEWTQNPATTQGILSVLLTNQTTGCSKNISTVISLRQLPNPNLQGQASVCVGKKAIYFTNVAPISTYSWNITPAGMGTVTATAPNGIEVLWTTAGTATVSLTETRNGCSKTISSEVTIKALPTFTIAGATSVCEGSQQTYTATSDANFVYSWSVFKGDIEAVNGNSVSVRWDGGVATDTLRLSVYDASTGCSSLQTLTVSVSPLPTPDITGASPLCAHSQGVTYSTPANPNFSYVWKVLDTYGNTVPFTSAGNSISVNWGASASGTVEVTETSSVGCSKTITKNIVLNPLPVPAIVGNEESCALSYDVYETPLVAGNQYEWTITGGSFEASISTDTKKYVLWGAAGTGTLTLKETIPNTLCAKTVTKTVLINALPTPVIAGANQVCASEAGVTYSVPNIAGHSYQWLVIGGSATGTNTAQITVDWGTGTSGFIQLQEVNDVTGCSQYTFLTVMIHPLPTVNITGATNVCGNSTITYNTEANANHTYSWSVTGGNIIGANNGNSVVVQWGNGGGTPEIALIKTDNTYSTNCQNYGILPITINALPTPSISPTSAACAGATVTYQTNSNANAQFVWEVQGGNIIGANNGNSVVVQWGNGASGTLKVTETNGQSCSAYATATITLAPLPAPAIAGNLEVCASSLQTYEAALLPNETAQWAVSGGTIAGTASTTNGVQITVLWSAAGVGNIALTLTRTGASLGTSCSKSITTPVVVHSLPTPVISGEFVLCAFTKGAVYQVQPTAGHSYTWSVVGGNITSATTGNAITVDWGDGVTLKSVTVVQTDNNFPTLCAQTATLAVQLLPLPAPQIEGDVVVCASETGASSNFSEIEYATPLFFGHEYVWNISNNGIIVSGQNTNKVKVRWLSGSTTGFVRVTQTSNSLPSCSVSAQLGVTINPLPVLDFNIEHTCFGELTTFSPTQTGTNWVYKWEIFDVETTVYNTSNPIVAFTAEGLKKVWLTVIDMNNPSWCSYKIQKEFTINPVPVADFAYSGSCRLQTTLTPTNFQDLSTLKGVGQIVSWAWDFGDGSTANVQNPSHTYAAAGMYPVKLTVTSDKGCSHTANASVRIFEQKNPTELAPYTEDFEGTAHGWLAYGKNSSWGLGTPSNRNIVTTSRIWSTGLTNDYANSQISFVESPCFTLEQLDKPMLSFDFWSDSESQIDGAWLQYTVDDGKTWYKLGEIGKGVNWYNQQNILAIPFSSESDKRMGWTGKLPKPDSLVKQTAKYTLDAIRDSLRKATSSGTVRFAIGFGSNLENAQGKFDGFAFDNFYIGNRRQRALVEHFTMQGATAENNAVDNFTLESTKLQYHTQGQFYQDAPADVTARSLLYGISVSSASATRAALNGKTQNTKTFSEWVPDAAEQLFLGSPAFSLKLAFLPTPVEKLNVSVDITATADYANDVVLHMVMVERQIDLNSLTFCNIVKKMLPSAAGKAIRDGFAKGDTYQNVSNLTLYDVPQSTPTAPKFYDWNQLKIVVFLQDFTTNEVLQVAEAVPSTLPTRVSALADDGQGDCIVYPNPANQEAFIGFEEAAFRTYQWEILTLQGQKIGQGTIEKGAHSVRIDTQNYPSGLYIVRIINPQNKTSWVGKLVIRK